LAEGDREAVVETAIRYFTLVSDADMAALRAAPSWPGRVAGAHTISRECAAGAPARLDPQSAARITVRVLLLVGEQSLDPAKPAVDTGASTLPDARIELLAGQEHVADAFAPDLVAERLLVILMRPG
jgi:pimeloyl-ACP methyl ester carboxylesterase